MDDLLPRYTDDFQAFAEQIDLTKFEPTDQSSVPPPPCTSLMFHPVWNTGEDSTGGTMKAVRFDVDAKDPAHPYNKAQSRVKRPMNSFMLFSNEMRPILQDQNKALTNNDISKMLGQMWKDMPYEEKRPYLERAMEIKTQFNACHPDYTYTKSPRKRQKINKLRKFAALEKQDAAAAAAAEAAAGLLTPAPASASDLASAASSASAPASAATLPAASSSATIVEVAGEKQVLSPELIRSVVNQVSEQLQLSSHDPRVCVLL